MQRRHVLVGLAALVAGIAGFAASGGFSVGPPTMTVHSVRSIAVPARADQLITRGDRLELSACAESDPTAWFVDPATLALQPTQCRTASAAGPAGAGAVAAVAPGFGASTAPAGSKVALEWVQLGAKQAVWDCRPESEGLRAVRPGAGSRKSFVGPILFRFAGSCSTTRPISVVSGGSIWIYDCTTGASGRDGHVVQLSASTGTVETSLAIPADCWTSFDADEDGSFVASYDNGGPIYFVASGGHRPVVALSTAGRVNWFAASGTAVYADVGAAGGTCAPVACGIWRFQGPRATAQLVVRDPDADTVVAATVIGSPLGFFAATTVDPSLLPEGPSSVQVLWTDPAASRMRRLPTPGAISTSVGLVSLAYVTGWLFVFGGGTLARYDLS